METNAKIEDKRYLAPACSISEEGGIVTVKVEMPGVAKDGIDVQVEGNSLSLTGRREPGTLEGRYLLRERRSGSYRKIFTIDDTIDRDKIDAELADGILTIKLLVKEAAKPKRIAIS